MGMDLVARSKDVEPIHFNWTGWGQLGDLLEALGCDLSEMSGSNNGDYIKAATCREWAKALKEATIQGLVGTTDGKLSVGGFPLSKEDKDWLKRSWKFFESCRGCRQY